MRPILPLALAAVVTVAACAREADTPLAPETAAVAAAPGLASVNANYVATLTPEAEVQTPPVVSRATGVATLKVADDGASIRYFVNAAGLEDVLFAHLHLAPAGRNGPVVVTLGGAVTGPQNGRYATGTITAADLVGPLAGGSLADLVAAIERGEVYVNVHSADFPGGELRGQVR